MKFLENDFSVKIISILLLDWDSNNVTVPKRNYNAISFRLNGSAEFSNGQKTQTANDNAIVFMPEGVGYHLKSDYEKIIVIHFELEGEKQNDYEVINTDNYSVLRELFIKALETWNGKKLGYYLKTMSVFYRILEKISLVKAENSNHSSFDKIKKSIRYLHENFTDSQLTVETLYNISNMSDTYFRKLFYDNYKTTPNKYLTELRLSYAEELLGSGFYTVERVAERCGFEDPKYFSKLFKKKHNLSPSVYSRKLK